MISTVDTVWLGHVKRLCGDWNPQRHFTWHRIVCCLTPPAKAAPSLQHWDTTVKPLVVLLDSGQSNEDDVKEAGAGVMFFLTV